MVTHRVTIKGLEVQVVVCDADMARVDYQRGHHLSHTLHMRPLRHTLKAAHIHRLHYYYLCKYPDITDTYLILAAVSSI